MDRKRGDMMPDFLLKHRLFIKKWQNKFDFLLTAQVALATDVLNLNIFFLQIFILSLQFFRFVLMQKNKHSSLNVKEQAFKSSFV